MTFNYDVIVIGAGHAGCEAATAAANMGANTCLITIDMNKIAQMSCNPAVGGIAKGQIVREIDALGGQMGIVTDTCTLQFRMLNISKGPAMWSPRAQCDRAQYIQTWRQILDQTPNLHIWQDEVTEIIVENSDIQGVKTLYGVTFRAPAVVVTAGTFLNGLMHIGRTKVPGGRCAEPAALQLTDSITRHGIRVGRMKTGTPVRIDKRSVDFSLMQQQDGDAAPQAFSYLNTPRQLPQLPCHIVYTTPEVHEKLREGFADSPLFNGQIQSIGPRYCPSIETKLHTFPDRDSHMLFLEPEGANTNEMYLNGFSSSLPINIQLEALRLIPAFRNLQAYRPGYAIEYDYFDPTQLTHSLESKLVGGLFFAGQVNGTTGYEEAAGQGIIAGINAALKVQHKPAFTLQRNQAYIGVLIDDLVTKGVDEPYRMFTSRAEYRILLRQDNADARLTPLAYQLGLASTERYQRLQTKLEHVARLTEFIENYNVKPSYLNTALASLNTTPLQHGCKLSELLGRPQITLTNILPHIPKLQEQVAQIDAQKISPDEVLQATEINIKYSGYIKREEEQAGKMLKLENIKIAGKFNYLNMNSITIEARQKLHAIQPVTLAQASRIPGVSPSDINVLMVLLNKK